MGNLVLGSEERYGYPSVRTYRNSLWKELVREALAVGISIRFGWKFSGIQREDTEDALVVNFANGERVKADVVVGADGIHSKLRTWLYPGSDAQYSGQTVVYAFGTKEGMEVDEGQHIPEQLALFGENGSFFMLATDPAAKEILFFSTLEIPDRSKEEWENLNSDKQQLPRMLRDRFSGPEWPKVVRHLLKNTSEEMYTCWP